ncbi:hypothetical protein GIB67_038265 [Kingdonia uniflora]|uniref:NAB domain-containing protein n=1 Tax=Kingdonia uniflora TaxID=39325 RepID=A0A7J7MSJ1_9MAGN|nr:hypothetical protein GIB67_038265 [Kingdonia uniflora]
MLKLIEEDADSFAQRAEMYYKKRPELIIMVEDFYKTHRSLLERFDRLNSGPKTPGLLTPTVSPFATKYQAQKLHIPRQKSCDSYSECFDYEEFSESEVEDPEQVEESVVDVLETQEVACGVSESIVAKLREEIERLKKENKVQKDQLTAKDEEKREVIRQLSISMDILKENVVLSKKSKFKESSKKKGSFEFNKLKGLFSGMMLFNGSSKSHTNCVAL